MSQMMMTKKEKTMSQRRTRECGTPTVGMCHGCVRPLSYQPLHSLTILARNNTGGRIRLLLNSNQHRLVQQEAGDVSSVSV